MVVYWGGESTQYADAHLITLFSIWHSVLCCAHQLQSFFSSVSTENTSSPVPCQNGQSISWVHGVGKEIWSPRILFSLPEPFPGSITCGLKGPLSPGLLWPVNLHCLVSNTGREVQEVKKEEVTVWQVVGSPGRKGGTSKELKQPGGGGGGSTSSGGPA